MGSKLDAEFEKAIEHLIPILRGAPQIPIHDIAARGVGISIHQCKSFDGTPISVFQFQSRHGKVSFGPTIVHFLGGGMFAGSVEAAKTSLSQVVSRTGVKIFSIDYRLAPEHPHPAPVEGCYSGLHFVSQNAQRLGVDPARIAAMGESAGGGLAAATALLAQDRELKPKLAKQILVSPSSTIALLKPLWRMESF